jgi:hypothetical protein
MKWFLAKLVFQIVCGDGRHTPQFDEQLRLFSAEDEETAVSKAMEVGKREEDCFYNNKEQLVQWIFVGVPEALQLHDFSDGAEIYSRINEVDDGERYAAHIKKKTASLLPDTALNFSM